MDNITVSTQKPLKTTKMKKLGLTGSIATGKSTALKYFSDLGHAIFSADDVVHEIYLKEAVPIIAEFHPPAIVNGIVDRSVLANYLIKNHKSLLELEKLIHPLIYERYLKFVKKSQNDGKKLVIADIPLLFESSFDYGFDAIAVTFCSQKEQYRRALARKGMSEKKLQSILKRQMGQQEKKTRADYFIDTEISLEATKNQVVQIAKDILQNRS